MAAALDLETVETSETREPEMEIKGGPDGPFRDINSPSFLEAVRAGNSGGGKIFTTLVLRTHHRLASYIGRYFSDPDTVQDILQETYLAVHMGLPRFEARCRLSTWIYSLAHHKVCDRLAEKYRRFESDRPEADVLPELPSPAPLQDETLFQSRLAGMVEDASGRLPWKYREAHNLRDREGLNGEETAAILGIPEALVRVRLHRARCMIVEAVRKRVPGNSVSGKRAVFFETFRTDRKTKKQRHQEPDSGT